MVYLPVSKAYVPCIFGTGFKPVKIEKEHYFNCTEIFI